MIESQGDDPLVRCRISASSSSPLSLTEEATGHEIVVCEEAAKSSSVAERSAPFVISIGADKCSRRDSMDSVDGVVVSSPNEDESTQPQTPHDVIIDSEVPIGDLTSASTTESRPRREYSPSGRKLPPPPIILRNDGKEKRKSQKRARFADEVEPSSSFDGRTTTNLVSYAPNSPPISASYVDKPAFGLQTLIQPRPIGVQQMTAPYLPGFTPVMQSGGSPNYHPPNYFGSPSPSIAWPAGYYAPRQPFPVTSAFFPSQYVPKQFCYAFHSYLS